MIAVFPESSFPLFPLVELLGGPPGDQLHRLRNGFSLPAVKHQQVNVVAGDHIIEDPQFIALLGFKQPTYPGSSVSCKFEKKFPLVAPVRNVPGVSGEEVSFRSGHKERTPPVVRRLFLVPEIPF